MAMRADGGITRSSGRTSGSRSARGSSRSGKGGSFGRSSGSAFNAIINSAKTAAGTAKKASNTARRNSNPTRPTTPSRGGNYSGGNRSTPSRGGGGGGFGGGGYSGGGGGTSYDTYGGGAVAPNAFGAVAEIAPPAPPTDDEWWNSDSGFQAEQGSLKTSLDSALANLTQQRTGYDTDFMTTLKNLGWGWGDNTKLDGFEKGAFDPTNQLGAYGQGLTGLNNDFASRGLMDSSFFADALTDFNTDMNNQYQGLVGGRNQFRNERAADELAANNEYKQALARARAESLARRDAQYGIV